MAAQSYLQMAEAQRKLGDLGAADAILREGTQQYPNDSKLLSEFARIAILCKDWSEALARSKCGLEALGERAPPSLYLVNSTAHRKLGDLGAADTILCEGTQKHPENINLQSEFARIAIFQKDWPQALARSQRALNSLGNKAPATLFLVSGTAYRRLGKDAEAAAIVRRGLAKFPDDVPLALEDAEIAFSRGDLQGTIARCQSIIDFAGDEARTRVLMSMAHYKLGDACLETAMTRTDWTAAAKRLQEVLAEYEAKLPAAFYERVRDEGFDANVGNTKLSNVPNAIFVWIPKTAGTTIYNALRTAGCVKLKTPELAKRAFSGQGIVTFAHLNYSLLVKEGYIDPGFDENSIKFAFVRNPYRRAVSLYFYTQRYITTYNKKPSFLEFLELLSTGFYDSVGLYNVKNLSQCNPQVRWLDGLKMDFIGKVEEIEKDFQELQILLQLKLPKLGIYKKGLYENTVSFGQREKYLVEKIYDDDFVRFGYARDLPKG